MLCSELTCQVLRSQGLSGSLLSVPHKGFSCFQNLPPCDYSPRTRRQGENGFCLLSHPLQGHFPSWSALPPSLPRENAIFLRARCPYRRVHCPRGSLSEVRTRGVCMCGVCVCGVCMVYECIHKSAHAHVCVSQGSMSDVLRNLSPPYFLIHRLIGLG